jgi:heme exporter protein C
VPTRASQGAPKRPTASYGRGLRPLSLITAVAVAAAGALVFFYAPIEADQGFSQKIFYLHVPLAIVALLGFVAAGVMGALHLRSRDRSWDLRAYVAIHLSIILGVGVLATGMIWAKAAWGHWWRWEEPVLVSFLIVFLLYCVYFPLRFSIEDPDRQARYSSVFAIVAGVFVPLNFVAVRMVEQVLHPRTFSTAGVGLPAEMLVTFLVALVAMALLYVTLWKLELSAKHASAQLGRIRRRLELRAERRAEEHGASDPSSAVAAAPLRSPTI